MEGGMPFVCLRAVTGGVRARRAVAMRGANLLHASSRKGACMTNEVQSARAARRVEIFHETDPVMHGALGFLKPFLVENSGFGI